MAPREDGRAALRTHLVVLAIVVFDALLAEFMQTIHDVERALVDFGANLAQKCLILQRSESFKIDDRSGTVLISLSVLWRRFGLLIQKSRLANLLVQVED